MSARSTATCDVLCETPRSNAVIIDRFSKGGNMQSLPSVRLSVRLSIRLFPLYLRNRLTVDLELLRVSIGDDHRSEGTDGQGQGHG